MFHLSRYLLEPLSLMAALDLSEWRNWHFWVLGAFIASILEMLTPGFVLACLAIGCGASALADVVGLHGWLPQDWICAGATFLTFFLIRPFMLRTMRGAQSETGVDWLVGQETQIDAIGEHDGVPLAKIKGEVWRIQCAVSQNLDIGDRVRVIGVDGNRLLVEDASREPAPAP